MKLNFHVTFCMNFSVEMIASNGSGTKAAATKSPTSKSQPRTVRFEEQHGYQNGFENGGGNGELGKSMPIEGKNRTVETVTVRISFFLKVVELFSNFLPKFYFSFWQQRICFVYFSSIPANATATSRLVRNDV